MTVASLLKSQGYNTACIGKWHLGMDMQTRAGGVIQDAHAIVDTVPQFNPAIMVFWLLGTDTLCPILMDSWTQFADKGSTEIIFGGFSQYIII